MTICIAAIGKLNNEEIIVFATDHMITTPNGQFEHSIAKYKELNGKNAAMLAGAALLFDELVNTESVIIPNIKKDIFENFKKKRLEVIQNEILNVYRIDQDFLIESLKNQIPNQFINTMLEKISSFNLNTQILLVGFENGISHITEINESGIFDFRDINFHTIGTGSVQASNTLLFQKHSKEDNLETTVYNVYKAKRNAEVMPGVGKEMDLLILTKKGIIKLGNEKIKILQDIYQKELEFGKTNQKLKDLKII